MTGKRQNPHFRKLLVGYDGSPQSDKAVDVALSLAECIDSTVLIFAVARPPEPSVSIELEAVLDDAREHFEEGFKKRL
jgi:nucleotide-binding universal stress UspA family protein